MGLKSSEPDSWDVGVNVPALLDLIPMKFWWRQGSGPLSTLLY